MAVLFLSEPRPCWDEWKEAELIQIRDTLEHDTKRSLRARLVKDNGQANDV